MKNLLVKHGEKFLLLVVVGICVFVVLQNIDGLLVTSGVNKSEQDMIDRIKQELSSKQPPVYEIAPYKETLRRAIEGNGIAMRIAARAGLPTRLVHEIPVRREKLGAVIQLASLGKVKSLEAKASRGRVELTWSVPKTERCAIEHYEIFRDGKAEPISKSKVTSFVDSGLSPQTEYSYSVRAIGRINKSEDEDIEIRWAKSSSMKVKGELCFTPKTAPKSAKTPSDLELECRGVNKQNGVAMAVIYGKKWDSKTNTWIEYKSGANFKVGDKVRPYMTTPQMQRIFLETGYIIKRTKEEVRIIKKPVERIVRQDDGSFKKIIVFIDVNYTVRAVYLQEEKGKGTLTLEFWPIKPPTGATGTARPKPKPKTDSDILGGIREQMKDAQANAEDGKDGAPKNTYDTTGWKSSKTGRGWAFVAPSNWELGSDTTAMRMFGLEGLTGTLSDGYSFSSIARDIGLGLVAIELNDEATRTSGITKRGWDGLKAYAKRYALKAEVGAEDAQISSQPSRLTLNGSKMSVAVVNYKVGGNDYVLRVYAVAVQGKLMIVYAAGQKMLMEENRKLLDAITAAIK